MTHAQRITAFVTLIVLALTLGVSALAAGAPAAPAPEAAAGVTISGRVFHDLDMVRDMDTDEPAVDGAVVTLSNGNDSWTQNTSDVDEFSGGCTGPANGVPADCDRDGVIEPAGGFTFVGVAPGSYTLSYTYSSAPFLRDDRQQPHQLMFRPLGLRMSSVNFGLVLKLIVSGRVYTDANGNGAVLPQANNWPARW